MKACHSRLIVLLHIKHMLLLLLHPLEMDIGMFTNVECVLIIRVSVSCKNGVPSFTPELPDPCILGKDAVSRDFFLHKSIPSSVSIYL